MNAKELQELIDFISKSGLNKVDIETSDFRISVTRESAPKMKYSLEQAPIMSHPISQPTAQQYIPSPQPMAQQPQAPAPSAGGEAGGSTDGGGSQGNLITIKSPMIGTFYRSSSPETPSFVNVG